MFTSKTEVYKILNALGQHLSYVNQGPIDLLICGGSALQALGLISRATKDVDILAVISQPKNNELLLESANTLPPHLMDAAKKVAKDFNLPNDWLNSGPTSAIDFGLPEGTLKRAEIQQFGSSLTLRFLSRYDQIHLKLYAATDQGGKHYEDLLNLHPTSEELEKAAVWSMTHDVSEGYKQALKNLLCLMGHNNVAQRI